MKAPTTDQLRNDIDRGVTGKKVAAPDLATVPLGTDAEAAGAPPTARERRLEATARPKLRGGHTYKRLGPFAYLATIVVVGLVLVGIVLMAHGG